jgi:hypothetical protein
VLDGSLGDGLRGAGAGPGSGRTGMAVGVLVGVLVGAGGSVGGSVGVSVFVGVAATTASFRVGVLVGGSVRVGVLIGGAADSTAAGTRMRSGAALWAISCSAASAAAGFNGGRTIAGASQGL